MVVTHYWMNGAGYDAMEHPGTGFSADCQYIHLAELQFGAGERQGVWAKLVALKQRLQLDSV